MRRRRHNRPKPKAQIIQRFHINEQILSPRVLVINETGEMLGEMDTAEAIALAKGNELDLVEVSPQATPPVCRITDYGKLQYREAKQAQVAKTKQKKVETKGIRIGFRTDTHDLSFKKNQAEKFMLKGNKVKVELVLRGREKAMNDKARENITTFIAGITVPHKFEEEIKRGPMGFTALIVPE